MRNIVGKKFGMLTALESGKRITTKNGRYTYFWKFQCDCGNACVKNKNSVIQGYTLSCGCNSSRHTVGDRVRTHNMTGTTFYNIFHSLRDRCTKPTATHYFNYGGRGIKCLWNSFDEFKEDMYESYLQHIKEFGNNTSIDRIDNNGNYCKENCRWATWKEQSNNRRSNRILSFDNKSLSISEWADIMDFPVYIISDRLGRGWTVERAITQKLRYRKFNA